MCEDAESKTGKLDTIVLVSWVSTETQITSTQFSANDMLRRKHNVYRVMYYDGTETTYSSIPFGTSPGRRCCGITYPIRIQWDKKTDRYASRYLVSTLIVRGRSARLMNAMLDRKE